MEVAAVQETATVIPNNWQENRLALGIVADHKIETQDEQEKNLKTAILQSWKRIDQGEKAKEVFGKQLYELRKLLVTPGKTGGFDGWLKDRGIPHTTAYRYIGKYEKREGLLPALAAKEKKEKKTLSHVVQGPKIPDAQADFIPAPRTASEFTKLMDNEFSKLPAEQRKEQLDFLRAWLDDEEKKNVQ